MASQSGPARVDRHPGCATHEGGTTTFVAGIFLGQDKERKTKHHGPRKPGRQNETASTGLMWDARRPMSRRTAPPQNRHPQNGRRHHVRRRWAAALARQPRGRTFPVRLEFPFPVWQTCSACHAFYYKILRTRPRYSGAHDSANITVNEQGLGCSEAGRLRGSRPFHVQPAGTSKSFRPLTAGSPFLPSKQLKREDAEGDL